MPGSFQVRRVDLAVSRNRVGLNGAIGIHVLANACWAVARVSQLNDVEK